MNNIDIFGDQRRIPKININFKIKVKTVYENEINNWNSVFGYFMKKPRTKLEFFNTSDIRNMDLSKVTLDKIKDNISNEDYLKLKQVEKTFNEYLTNDIKSFILAVLRFSSSSLNKIL